MLIARNHGLAALKILLKDERFSVITIFSHKYNPKLYDPEQKIRSDFEMFTDLSSRHNIPIFTVDYKDEKIKLEKFASNNDFDFLISISWRYLIPQSVFSKSKIGSFNIHRGDLPKYAGSEPIRKALENHEKNVVVTSHQINENYDEGEPICSMIHPTNYDENQSMEANVERLKVEITKYFPLLTIKSIESLLQNIEK